MERKPKALCAPFQGFEHLSVRLYGVSGYEVFHQFPAVLPFVQVLRQLFKVVGVDERRNSGSVGGDPTKIVQRTVFQVGRDLAQPIGL
jgi:hypothetical protein